MKLLVLAASVLMAGVLTGCGETPDDPVDGSYRFIHAAADTGIVGFSLEQIQIASLDYASGNAATTLDSGLFDFNLVAEDSTGANNDALLSQAVNLQAESDSLLVLYSDNGTRSLRDYVTPQVEPPGSGALLRFLHASSSSPAVDFYLEADGADLLAATPRANLSYQDLSDSSDLPSGEFRLSITAAADPQTLLFQSPLVTVTDGEVIIFAVFDGAGSTAASLRVSRIEQNTGGTLLLADQLRLPDWRFINAVLSGGDVDLVFNGDFANPFQAAVMPGETRDFTTLLAAGEQEINITPAGDPGVLEVTQTVTTTGATRQTQIIGGTPGDITSAVYVEDLRGIRGRNKLRIRLASAFVDFVNVFIEEPGTDITDAVPVAAGLASSGPGFNSNQVPGDYEITFVLNDQDGATTDTTIIGGPFAISLAELAVVEIVVLDAPTMGQLIVQINDLTAN